MKTNPTPNVVISGFDDEPALMDLLRLHATEERPEAAIDDVRIRNVLHRGLAQDLAIVGVIRGPNRIEGSVGIYVSSWWFSADAHCDALWLFVHPDHRRSNHLKSLVNYAKWAADALGYPLIYGIWRTPQTIRKAEHFERQMPVGGQFFMYRGQEGPAAA